MTQGNNASQAVPDADDTGANFMEEVRKATQLHDADEVQRVAERRLREDPSYSGPRLRKSDRGHASEPAPQPEKSLDRAERTATRVATIWGAVVLVGGAALGGVTALLDARYQNEASASEAQAAIGKRFESVEGRVERLEGVTSEILTQGRETQELQLADRINQIDQRLDTFERGSEIYRDYLRQRGEVQQRLDKVCAALGKQCPMPRRD